MENNSSNSMMQYTFIREPRVNYRHCEHLMFKVDRPLNVAKFVRSILTDGRRQHLFVFYLDGQHRVTGYSIVSSGFPSYTPVALREVFQRALLAGAIAIAVAHNHPYGSPTPSNEDRAVTRQLQRAGNLLGIKLVDHVLVTDRSHYSMRDEGNM